MRHITACQILVQKINRLLAICGLKRFLCLEKENTLEHGHMFSEVATEGKQLENPTGEFYGPGLEVACVTSAHVPEFLSLICLQKRLEKLTSCAQQAKRWGECAALFLPQCTCLFISLRSSFLSPKMCAFRIQVGDGG